jgi:hypothetical protein
LTADALERAGEVLLAAAVAASGRQPAVRPAPTEGGARLPDAVATPTVSFSGTRAATAPTHDLAYAPSQQQQHSPLQRRPPSPMRAVVEMGRGPVTHAGAVASEKKSRDVHIAGVTTGAATSKAFQPAVGAQRASYPAFFGSAVGAQDSVLDANRSADDFVTLSVGQLRALLNDRDGGEGPQTGAVFVGGNESSSYRRPYRVERRSASSSSDSTIPTRSRSSSSASSSSSRGRFESREHREKGRRVAVAARHHHQRERHHYDVASRGGIVSDSEALLQRRVFATTIPAGGGVAADHTVASNSTASLIHEALSRARADYIVRQQRDAAGLVGSATRRH